MRTDKRALRQEIREALEERPPRRRGIVVVEDDSDVRQALRLLLERTYEVVGVSSGDKLLDMLDSYDPVLLILDINLPGKNGFQLCSQVRSSPRHRHLPVIFLTARRDYKAFINFIETSADAFLNKPFEKKELRETVQRLVGSERQQ